MITIQSVARLQRAFPDGMQNYCTAKISEGEIIVRRMYFHPGKGPLIPIPEHFTAVQCVNNEICTDSVTIISKNLTNRLEYIALRLLQAALTVLPRPLALFLGGVAGMIMYRTGIYRSTVSVNMNHVALWDPDTARKITRELYSNMGKYTVDFLRSPYPLPPYRVHGYKEIEPLFSQGKGTVVILGHIGNWELLATVFGKMTGKLNVIAKPMRNPLVDRWLLDKRNASSVTTIYSAQALRRMMSVLKKDGIVAILIDQYMRQHGSAVPFLGKEAMTVSTAAGIALKTGCNVISVEAILSSDGSYDITVLPAPHEEMPDMTDEQRVLRLQTIHNDIISRQIMAHPSHWFGWFHRRFRNVVDYSASRSRKRRG